MNYLLEEQSEDGVLKLEAKVVMAMSRLQRGKNSGVAERQLVEYLSTTYTYLDGDIESQVMTALLSCVKSGIICSLGNGKYRLVGPSPRSMVSCCMRRSAHGPRCGCLTVVNNTSKVSLTNTCCLIKSASGRPKQTTNTKKASKQKSTPKPKTAKTKKKKARTRMRKPAAKSASKLALNIDPGEILTKKQNAFLKCSYCLELHPPPSNLSIFMERTSSELTLSRPFKELPPPEDGILKKLENKLG